MMNGVKDYISICPKRTFANSSISGISIVSLPKDVHNWWKKRICMEIWIE